MTFRSFVSELGGSVVMILKASFSLF